jgi:glycosyltransferase involved in cell wall biosynthesis
MPCLNEAETLEICIRKAQRALRENNIVGEVVVADNGSTDSSCLIADGMGARVVHVDSKGYGSALMGGIKAAHGRYILMGDADDSYDFTALGAFIEKLREGYDLVMGNRFQGGIKPGAMPVLHRYLGNPLLTALGRLLFGSPCGDFHCGLRGFKKAALLRLDLHTTGMEFASEMVVKATLNKLRITEVPTTLSPDGRSRPPHLRTWRDGWRHLRFLLLYSPRWLFLYPGVLLMLMGLITILWLLPARRAWAQSPSIFIHCSMQPHPSSLVFRRLTLPCSLKHSPSQQVYFQPIHDSKEFSATSRWKPGLSLAVSCCFAGSAAPFTRLAPGARAPLALLIPRRPCASLSRL